jgi:hypothetical protein
MSYFGLPRLCFFGTFRASPSTINNTDANFAEPPLLVKLWNPKGAHDFQLLRGNEFTIPPSVTVKPCAVQSVMTPSGTFVTDPATDPLIGQFVISTNAPAVGKLVDLDPDQQQVSQVWGMQLGIGDPVSDWLVADYEAAYFQQIFTSRAPGGFAIGFSAAYQSKLVNLQWPANPVSPTLQALKAASPDCLSIRFNVDRLDAQPTLSNGAPNPNFTLGRISGTIGPATVTEPSRITVGRMLRPGSAPPPAALKAGGAKEDLPAMAALAAPAAINTNFNLAPALVDSSRNVVTIDLGNALPFNGDGTPANAGTLQLAVQTSTGNVVLGGIANTADNYRQRAFLFEVPLGGNSAAVASNPLVVLSNGNIVMTENPTGAWIDAAQHVYRMDASTDAEVTLYSTVFGAPPPAGQNVDLDVQAMGNGTNQQPLIVTPQTVTLGHDGTAPFTMSSGIPGNPRGPIDGQVYAVTFTWNEDTIPDQSAFVSAHVYDAFTAPVPPAWSDVQPIFKQIMILYPFMQSILDLSDEATVAANAALIASFMRLPVTDPHFMPVTRDLSGPKTAMILAWLDAQGGAH